MKDYVANTVYSSEDRSLPVSDKPYRYPINSLLSQTVNAEDELKIILLIKKAKDTFYERNATYYKQEMEDICRTTGAKAEFVSIYTDFSQEKENHEQLMKRIVDEIYTGAHIMVDITYGPKDLPIVVFSALNFAEKFLRCEIDNIVYGQAAFKDNKIGPTTPICDMIPLYCLSSVTNIIRCDEPEKARRMLGALLEL